MSVVSARRDELDEVGRGPLSRGAAAVYRMIVLEGMMLLVLLPSVVMIIALGQDPSNAPLFVLSLVLLPPALVAGIAAVEAWRRKPDLTPARAFVLAYRRDFLTTLIWASPATAVLAVLAFNLIHLDQVDGAAAMRPLLILLAVAIITWSGHMLPLTAAFRFRTRDAARIALALIVPQWRYTLGILSLVLIAGTVVLTVSPFVLLLFAWAFPAMIALLARPLIAEVTERFT